MGSIKHVYVIAVMQYYYNTNRFEYIMPTNAHIVNAGNADAFSVRKLSGCSIAFHLLVMYKYFMFVFKKRCSCLCLGPRMMMKSLFFPAHVSVGLW